MTKYDDFIQKNKKSSKNGSQMVSQKVTLFWENVTLAPLLAPLAPQVVFYSKNTAKVLQRWSQGRKNDSKRDPKVVEVGLR